MIPPEKEEKGIPKRIIIEFLCKKFNIKSSIALFDLISKHIRKQFGTIERISLEGEKFEQPILLEIFKWEPMFYSK